METYELRRISYSEDNNTVEIEFKNAKSGGPVIRKLKLNNELLENLIKVKDPFVGPVYLLVMNAIKDYVPWPSWYKAHMYEKQRKLALQEAVAKHEKEIAKTEAKIREANAAIKQSESDIRQIVVLLEDIEKRRRYIVRKIKRKRKFNMLRGLSEYEQEVYGLEQDNLYYLMLKEIQETRITDSTRDINKAKDTLVELEENLNEEIEEINQEYKEIEESIKPLSPAPTLLDGYIPLSEMAGMQYRKIIGCYVIRNRKNRKVYVGQSKDVMKRITKEHFKGTKVKNSVFAEDYYETLKEERANLFEVKIIPCGTKDELDRVEKQLIKEYDSYNKGYNRTRGNM